MRFFISNRRKADADRALAGYLSDGLNAAGFDGWVCPEYLPLGGTEASLGWLRDWGYWA